MSSNLVRRGATLVVGAALLGGVLAVSASPAAASTAGGSTDVPSGFVGSAVGFVPDLVSGVILLAGTQSGSIDQMDIFQGCSSNLPSTCPEPWPTTTQVLLAYLQGNGVWGPFPALPWAPESTRPHYR
jgi:hypothetical protein